MTATVGENLLLGLTAACLLVGARLILAFWRALDEEVAEEPERPYDWARDSGLLNSWADDAMAESELLRVLPYPKEDR